MSNKVAEINEFLTPDSAADWIVGLWTKWDDQRQGYLESKRELRNFLFATDTSTTTNKKLPWKNTTTIPKLCQLRDNLHSNYLQALFPNDKWVSWEAYTPEDAVKAKSEVIRAYIENKAREGGVKDVVSDLLYDYIDGNAFATTSYEAEYKMVDGEKVSTFVGPRIIRIPPEDIVFNPLAATFDKSPKIIRSWKSVGELKKLAETNPDEAFWIEALNRRTIYHTLSHGLSREDYGKVEAYHADGFGSVDEYYGSGIVEILEFYGDYHNIETGDLEVNKRITVIDRCKVVRNDDIPTYDGKANIYHVGWRKRPDNLWAMGPLDNLVGMQYRIDHIENSKADAFDLAIMPPKVIAGEVEAFEWGPNAEILIDENGSVTELGMNLNAIITGGTQISEYEDRMELFAGAPREAMGIRTPGEKTAFEVQQLNNASGRIFQEKASTFEEQLLEKLLNSMLEQAHRNIEGTDTIRLIDKDIGSTEFRSITKADITANGIIRPVGARHFAQKAQELQNIIGVLSTPIAQKIDPHTSGKNLTKFIEDVVDIRSYEIFGENVAITEQQETQSLINQSGEDLEMEAQAPLPEEVYPNEEENVEQPV